MNVSTRLKQLMDERKITKFMLAKRADISWNTVNNILSCDGNPTIETLSMLCKGLGISLVQFFDEDEEAGGVTIEQQHLLNRWENLNERDKRIVDAMIDTMLQEN